MEQRIDFVTVSPGGVRALSALERHVHESGLDGKLLHLLKLRASQINGCAYCIDMHTKDARAAGETEQRLYGTSAWRETPFYSERERAALAWTEAVTRIGDDGVSDALFEHVREQFSETELVDLTFAIVAINAWNRLAIPFRSPVGSYQPRRAEAHPAGAEDGGVPGTARARAVRDPEPV